MKYLDNLKKKVGIGTIFTYALFLTTLGLAGYGGYRIDKKFKEIEDSLKEIEKDTALIPEINEMLKEIKKNTDEIPGIYETIMGTKKYTDADFRDFYEYVKMLREGRIEEMRQKIFSKRTRTFEEDPDKWSVLGLPEGSHIEGEYKKGGDYKVITPVKGEKFDFSVPVIKGNADMIRVRVGNGSFYEESGKPIEISFTKEEMDILRGGGKVPYQVMGISAEDEIITGSFANGFFEMGGAGWTAENSVGP